MEIRMRSAVSRTAKGYSIESTLDISHDDTPLEGRHVFGKTGTPEDIVADLSAFQVNELQKHMAKLGEAFPREVDA